MLTIKLQCVSLSQVVQRACAGLMTCVSTVRKCGLESCPFDADKQLQSVGVNHISLCSMLTMKTQFVSLVMMCMFMLS